MPHSDNGNRWPRQRHVAIAVALTAAMVLPVAILRGPGGILADPGDFIFLAMLTGGALLAVGVASRVPARSALIVAAALASAAGAIGLWINLAVGIVGSEENPVNMVFVAPAALAAMGAVIVRSARGALARVMLLAGGAQLLAGVIVFATGAGFTGPITLFLTTLWVAAAMLFARAARAYASTPRR